MSAGSRAGLSTRCSPRRTSGARTAAAPPSSGETVLDLFDDYTLRTVALGSAALGITSGALGTFAVLRRQSLLGDAISHAAHPGVAIAFLLTGSKAPIVLVTGAALAAVLLRRDLVTMAILGGIAIAVMLLVWKELKLLAFDPDYGASLGFPMRALDVLLTSLLVVAIVIGLQTVGVVLMAAMVIAPFAAARQWTDRLGVAAGMAAVFGAVAGIVGSVLSSEAARLPTGPTIVLCVTTIALLSLVFAGRRGLLWRAVRGRRDRRRLRLAAVLADLLALEQQHPDAHRGHSAAVLSIMSGGTTSSLEELERRGHVRRLGEDSWQLTDAGRERAAR